jgi:hypothetical protein
MQSLRAFLLNQYGELNNLEKAETSKQYRFINMIFNRINTNYISLLCENADSEEALQSIPEIPRIFSEANLVEAEHQVVNALKTELLSKARSRYLRLKTRPSSDDHSNSTASPTIKPVPKKPSEELADKKTRITKYEAKMLTVPNGSFFPADENERHAVIEFVTSFTKPFQFQNQHFLLVDSNLTFSSDLDFPLVGNVFRGSIDEVIPKEFHRHTISLCKYLHVLLHEALRPLLADVPSSWADVTPIRLMFIGNNKRSALRARAVLHMDFDSGKKVVPKGTILFLKRNPLWANSDWSKDKLLQNIGTDSEWSSPPGWEQALSSTTAQQTNHDVAIEADVNANDVDEDDDDDDDNDDAPDQTNDESRDDDDEDEDDGGPGDDDGEDNVPIEKNAEEGAPLAGPASKVKQDIKQRQQFLCKLLKPYNILIDAENSLEDLLKCIPKVYPRLQHGISDHGNTVALLQEALQSVKKILSKDGSLKVLCNIAQDLMNKKDHLRSEESDVTSPASKAQKKKRYRSLQTKQPHLVLLVLVVVLPSTLLLHLAHHLLLLLLATKGKRPRLIIYRRAHWVYL